MAGRGYNNDWSPRGQYRPRFPRGNKSYNNSPYQYNQNQQQNQQQQIQSPYQFQPPFSTSTPIRPYSNYSNNYSPQGGQGHFRGRGGRRPSFNNSFNNSPRSSFGHDRSFSSDDGGIDKWISPAMWDDPWKDLQIMRKDNLNYQRQASTTQFATMSSNNSESITNSESGLDLSRNTNMNDSSLLDMTSQSDDLDGSEIDLKNPTDEEKLPIPTDSAKIDESAHKPDEEDKTELNSEAQDILKLITS